MAKLLQEEEKQAGFVRSSRNYSRLSLMNSKSSLQYQRQMLLHPGREHGSRRHWSLGDIPRARLEVIHNRSWNEGSDDIGGVPGLTRRYYTKLNYHKFDFSCSYMFRYVFKFCI